MLCIVCSIALLVAAAVAWSQERPVTAALNNVRAMLSEGKADSALALIEGALHVDSTNVSLLIALADIQKARRQMLARRETLERIIRVQPRSSEARIGIAEDFFEANQLDSAAYFAYAALSRSNRQSVGAYYWLGRIHEQAGHADSALFYYRGAWVLLPDGDLF